MEPVEVLVERIDGNVKHVKERLDDHILASAGLSGRVSALEKTKDRAVAWGAGAAAVVAFVLWVLGVGGCAAPRTIARPLRMERRPVRVLVDDMLPSCELSAVEEATRFWASEGVALVVQSYVPDATVLVGDIYILDGDIPDPNIVGLTRAYPLTLLPGRPEIALAEITLDSCSPMAAAHELGHALGLEHRNVLGALMKPTQVGAGWGLSEGERRLVVF